MLYEVITNAGSNTMFKSEYRISTKTGTSIWIEESCKIVFTPNNEKLIFCSAKDITKHKNKLYNELETNKAWKNIISAIDTELILLSQDGIIQDVITSYSIHYTKLYDSEFPGFIAASV